MKAVKKLIEIKFSSSFDSIIVRIEPINLFKIVNTQLLATSIRFDFINADPIAEQFI